MMTVVVAGLVAPLLGQAPEAAQPLDYAARVESVATLKEHIAQREARFEALKKDLLTLDARVEERIDHVVKTLSTLKDSNNSKTRVANLKEEVIDKAQRAGGAGFNVLVIDTENQFVSTGFAKEVATAANGKYYYLPNASDAAIAAAASSAMAEAKAM